MATQIRWGEMGLQRRFTDFDPRQHSAHWHQAAPKLPKRNEIFLVPSRAPFVYDEVEKLNWTVKGGLVDKCFDGSAFFDYNLVGLAVSRVWRLIAIFSRHPAGTPIACCVIAGCFQAPQSGPRSKRIERTRPMVLVLPSPKQGNRMDAMESCGADLLRSWCESALSHPKLRDWVEENNG